MERENKIPLSKETNDLRGECRALMAERDKLNPAISKTLADDKTDLEKVGATLATLQAKRDIITARLARRRKELFSAVFADAQMNVDAARAKVKAATEAWRLQRDQWKLAVFAAHPKAAAQVILGDDRLLPNAIRDARDTLTEARQYQTAAESALTALDEPAWKIRRATAAIPVNGWITPDFVANAAKLAPEVRD